MEPTERLIVKADPLGVEEPKEVEKDKDEGEDEEKKDWKGAISSIALILGLAVIWFYFAAMTAGHDGVHGPWNLLCHRTQGQYAALFTAMIIFILLVGVKMGIISWKPARIMVIIAAVLIAGHVLALGIWQERWQPRKWLQSIGQTQTPRSTLVLETVFEKTYAFANAYNKEYGQIAVINFSDYPIQQGDVIEVVARVSGGKDFSGKEIYIWRGKNFTPKWARTSNGYYRVTVEKRLNKGRYIVSLDRRKDIEVTVRLVGYRKA